MFGLNKNVRKAGTHKKKHCFVPTLYAFSSLRTITKTFRSFRPLYLRNKVNIARLVQILPASFIQAKNFI